MGGDKLIAWRLDPARYASTWDSGEGAFLAGGRRNSIGVRVVYCSLDPATAILEVAIHKGFKTVDTAPHVLTALHVIDVSDVHIVRLADVPNANWLRPGIPGAGQQAFGDALLAKHQFVAIPSAVSNHSWNLIFDPTKAKGAYQQHIQEAFALDTRLHPRPSKS
ncbi:RES family NAD+ phosphorylase [Bradyrhizobium australafricanum]|uniref:RES family NAD+ phosphorylase n=1 Tax=Bradyrhizobium australafricanum TaxID=2821406 RepID=UPI001CE2ADBB|nr:RES domain-containing protein [Bradyrhizobium australafricanum]